MRKVLVANILALALAGTAAAQRAPKTYTITARKARGEPAAEPARAGYRIWVDKQGLHLRWTAVDKPLLYTGRIDTDRPLKEVKRLREKAGGWARAHGNRIVLFSSTVRPGQQDGVDVVIPGGRRVELQLDIDGKPPAPEQVFLGEQATNPPGTPLRLYLR